MKSPLAPATLTTLPAISGVKLAATAAGVRYNGRKDVMLMNFCKGSVLAGVFTQSATRSAPVLRSERLLGQEGQEGFAILVNSGNSNAFTGKAGEAACETCCLAVHETLNLPSDAVHMASTGVIGEVLPHEPIVDALDGLAGSLDEAGWVDAAEAIMTTDTFAKGSFREVDLGASVSISGIAKGSGMIAPNMATMLCFLATNAKISQELLQQALSFCTKRSFNAITVDSDTSTSDSVYLGATQQADMDPIISVDDPRFAAFTTALFEVMLELAHMIVKDGEGATKFVQINVAGAICENSARTVAMAIGNSPLVKTAIAGQDPNWGRVVAAIGKAGEPADRDQIRIWFGEYLVAEDGMVAKDYHEDTVAKYMKQDEIKISVELGVGDHEFTAWSCDLTKRYIEINADYRS